ncbi:MAG: DUF6907 domain-containing protein [Streptosporangiaceae bacterium]
MTTAASPVHGPVAGRRNRDGHLCPPWCITEHHRGALPARAHFGERVAVKPDPRRPHDMIEVTAADPGTPEYEHGAMVAVSGFRLGGGQGPALWVTPREAADLAAIVEQLATATPAQHHELAAAIRKAAAAITGAQADPEAWAFE